MSKLDGRSQAGPGTHMLRGSAWMIAMRWTMRLTGVVSTVILARLLTPEDFGIVAIAMIVVGMFEILSSTGQVLAIIRHRDPVREHYDTAWTISVLIGLGTAAAIFLIAPFTKIYFHDERAVLVMQCLALRAVLDGFDNVGILDFHRDLRFDQIFHYNLYVKIISFVVTVALAFLLRNYWALVGGILVGQVARTTLSYVVHPYRPRISFSKASELWAFSIWTFIRSIGSYFQRQVDVIAVGGALGTTSMGRYTVAKDIASSPTDEIVAPMSAVLFPVMARFQHDQKQLRQLYLRLLGWLLIIGSSTGIGLWLIAPDLVPLVLGQKWAAVTPLVGWLAVTASIDALNSGAYATLDVLGLPHLGARLQWLRVLAMAIAILPVAYWTRDLGNIVMTRFVITLIVVPTLLLVVGRRIGITPRDYGAAFWRPFVAGCLMVLAVCGINEFVSFTGPLRLGTDVSLGAATYIGTLLALWHVCGRPPSAERDLIAILERGQILLGTIRARVLKTVQ